MSTLCAVADLWPHGGYGNNPTLLKGASVWKNAKPFVPAVHALDIRGLKGILALPADSLPSAVPVELGVICRRVGNAFFSSGMFVAVQHDVPTETLDAVYACAEAFFAQDDAVKEEISMKHSRTFRGYSALGTEVTQGKRDMKETVDFGREEPEGEGFRGPNLFDAHVPGFKEAALGYYHAMAAFCESVMRAVAYSLNLPLDALLGADRGEPVHLFRYCSYPPAPADAKEAVQGIGEHTDYGLLAVLCATSGGLEVKDRAGRWQECPFTSRHDIVVNAGDVFELLTSGRVPSTVHRVVHRNTEQRLSLPFFFEPPFSDDPITPLMAPQLGRPDMEPIRYRSHVEAAFKSSYEAHAATLAF